MVTFSSSSRRGFQSGGRSFGAGVVVRVSKSGWAWAFRVGRSQSGSHQAPACVYVPFSSHHLAHGWCRQVAGLGWRAWVRRAKRCASAYEVKVVVPTGLSASAVRRQLPPCPSWLAEFGV